MGTKKKETKSNKKAVGQSKNMGKSNAGNMVINQQVTDPARFARRGR